GAGGRLGGKRWAHFDRVEDNHRATPQEPSSAMPIRFRCAYCNQLMGIARRKAGSLVRCPSCAGQIIVPNPEGGEGSGSQIREENAPLFERSDFDKVFDSAAGTKRAPEPAAAPRPMAAPPVPPLPVETRGEPVKQ